MKRIILIYAILLCAVVPSALTAQVIGETLATVNLTHTEAISSNEVEAKMQELRQLGGQAGFSPDQITREQVLESMIRNILIRQAAERDNISVNEQDMQRMLAQQKQGLEQQAGRQLSQAQFKQIVERQSGKDWQSYLDDIRQQILIQSYITQTKRELFQNIKQPTEAEIEEAYAQNKTEFTSPEYVRISHVFVNTQNKSDAEKQKALERLEEGLRKYRNGEIQFDDFVIDYSEDENSRFKGGDVGYVTRNNARVQQAYGREFFNTIFELDEGQASGIVNSNLGYHVVKVTEHRDARLLDLDDTIGPQSSTTVRQYISQNIYQRRQQQTLQRALQEVTQELKEQAEIKRYDS